MMKKRMLSTLLALCVALALTVPAFAAGTEETFVFNSATIKVHDVLRQETVSFPFVVYDYDELDENDEPTTKVDTWDLTVYIVDSEDYITFDVEANPGFEYSDRVEDVPDGGNPASYAAISSIGYQWDSEGGFAEFDFGHMYLTGPETNSWGYPHPYVYPETMGGIVSVDESTWLPYLLTLNDEWFMTEKDFATVSAAQPSQPTAPAEDEEPAAPAEPEEPTTPAEPEQPTTPSAPVPTSVVLSPQNLAVNGETIDCEKYNIDGSNYFKLRDLAQLLNGTGSQFAVGYDAETSTVAITTGEAYESTGTELAVGVDNSGTTQPSAQSIMIDGEAHGELTVYNIGGSNFFQLRELGSLLNFEVGYDVDTNTATVTSAQK